MVLLNSFVTDLGQYSRNRIFTLRIGFLIALVAGVGFLAEMPSDVLNFSERFIWMSLLIMQFRLWDDLADLSYDRFHYPDRILVRTGLPDKFRRLVIALMIPLVISFWVRRGVLEICFYGATVIWIAFVYYVPWKVFRNRFVRAQCLLLKYPLFIMLTTTSGSSRRKIISGALLYIFLSTFEWIDDPELRKGNRGAKLFTLSVAALVAILGYFNHD